MTTVLAAIDTSPTARSVLETALAVADLTGATAEAVHVQERTGATPDALATELGVPLQVLTDPVEASLLAAFAEPTVIAGVFGARATTDPARPLGHTALRLLEHTRKPVAVVPPTAVGGVPSRRFRRLLLPLEGSEESSRPIPERLYSLIVTEVDLVVLHVFTPATVPRTLDHPDWDLPAWGSDFLTRFCPDATHIELRGGIIGDRICEVCTDETVDLIALSWAQDMSPGHATVVRDVLAHATVPVLLLPTTLSEDPGNRP
jgi:nucleotide-binding universal stress UspA family protein